MRRLLVALSAVLLFAGLAIAQQLTVVEPPTVYPTVAFASLPSATTNTGRIYNVSNVGVNGSLWRSNGTNWSPVNGSVVLMQTGMPWIVISSGSISSVGALTGITAVAGAYPKAWCYLPANAVAAVSAAGWYYCTFSTTTAGTIFLDQPGATFPVVWPGSPTAVSAGQGSYTGVANTTAVETLPTITLPANAMGKNGKLHFNDQVIMIGATGLTLYHQVGGNFVGAITLIGNGYNVVNSYFNAMGATANQNTFTSTIVTGNLTSVRTLTTLDFTSSQTLNLAVQGSAGQGAENVEINGFSIVLENDGQ